MLYISSIAKLRDEVRAYISPISPPYLPISPRSVAARRGARLYLPYISPMSPYISAPLRDGARLGISPRISPYLAKLRDEVLGIGSA